MPSLDGLPTLETLGGEMENLDEYKKLYTHLCGLEAEEWKTTFSEIEAIIGDKLPDSARKYRGWWANKKLVNGLGVDALWLEAGWKSVDLDMDAETLTFVKMKGPEDMPEFNFAEIWPPLNLGPWPEGLVLTRDIAYTDPS